MSSHRETATQVCGAHISGSQACGWPDECICIVNGLLDTAHLGAHTGPTPIETLSFLAPCHLTVFPRFYF